MARWIAIQSDSFLALRHKMDVQSAQAVPV